MPTLRVLLESAPEPGRAAAWATFDDNERVLQSGVGAPETWPACDRNEAVLAAACVRIVALRLPPMPAAKLAAAATFALEDQLAGPADEQHIAVGAQRADGTVEAIVASRHLVSELAEDFDRILAEPALAPRPKDNHWRWYASGAGGGFVRKPEGAAFATSRHDGELPIELALALEHAARSGNLPTGVEAAFPTAGASAFGSSLVFAMTFATVDAWQWDAAGPAAFASATDLRQGEFADVVPAAARNYLRLFRLAATLAAIAIGLHIVASFAEWATLRLEVWRAESALASLARDAGVIGSEAPAVGLARRYADARHRAGLDAPADALPLLARAAPALATLPTGTLKTATYADGHWTLDLAKPEAGVADRLERQMTNAGLVTLQATQPAGVRMRVSLATGGP